MDFFDTTYSIILPLSTGDFHTQWHNCLSQLKTLAKDQRQMIFKINVFIDSSGSEDFQSKKALVTASIINNFVDDCPAFGILAISPEKPFSIAIEIGLVSFSQINVNYKMYDDIPYLVLEKNGYKEVWVNGIGTKSKDADTKSAADSAFEIMRQILKMENMSFNNVVRQWNYIGSILRSEEQNFPLSQNYQVFNKVRYDHYSRYRSVKGFPAATGVGMNYNGVMIDFCAIEPVDEKKIISIKNPKQINPYNYNHKVLDSGSHQSNKEEQPPLFERAKLLTNSNKWRIFVSGTASIIGQETTAIGDLAEQTRVTIENIKKLTSKENLVAHYPQISFEKPVNFSRIRVYVKNAGDIPEVKTICREQLGTVPSIYLHADICRNNLLVEIETEINS
jgi:enamine deaminase RidA (YjgF/YER057c/UK114 family)